MDKFYTSEKNTQILIALMKFHGVRKIIVSPGATNVCLVGSLQHDPYFEIYSSVDERSAAYIACGLARSSGEPVALSCTGATASRNYVSGLTEAYYSNLPILAITSTQHIGRIGHLMPQVIDRSNPMHDIAKKSIQIQTIHDKEDLWAAEVAINDGLLELRRHGGGPVHMNLVTTYSPDFSVKSLPKVRGIKRYCMGADFPEIPAGRIAICVGAHSSWNNRLSECVDEFCRKYHAVVVCEPISNYRGRYRVNPALLGNQTEYDSQALCVDLMIHLGTVSGFGVGSLMQTREVWRVHPDGEVRDTFRKMTAVFEMSEADFFCHYTAAKPEGNYVDYYDQLVHECTRIYEKVPELPFSNAWIAQHTVRNLPRNIELHLGILNSIRAWTLFDIPPELDIDVFSNTGGYGIDGLVSTLLGAAIANPDKLCIGIIGDLAFFYDMNAIGNRHVSNNIRLMVINNGRGTEFRNYNHPAACFGDQADAFMAAAGHYGNKSQDLVKGYAECLGFEYMAADSKKTYLENMRRFFSGEVLEHPVLFEVFTDSQDESDALRMLYSLEATAGNKAKQVVKDILGEKGVATLKKVMKK